MEQERNLRWGLVSTRALVVIGVTYHSYFPPYSTVFWHYKQWRAQGVIEDIRDVLHGQVRSSVKKKPNGQL